MKAFLKGSLHFLWRIIKWFLILSIASVILFRFVAPPFTPLMIIRCVQQLFDKDKQVRMSKDWVTLDKMSAALPLAVMAAEDQKFEDHFGFDFEAIKKAEQFNE